MSNLTFETPDTTRFPGLKLGHFALERGGNTACVINAANEVAVAAFLNEKISFPDIYRLIMSTLDKMPFIAEPTYEDYVASNTEARRIAQGLITKN